MRKLLIFALFGFLFSTNAVAQVGNGGAPIADVETQFYCYTSTPGGASITITKATWYVAGQDLPVLTIWHDTQGNEVTPLAEQITPGLCLGDNAEMSADSLNYDYLITTACDKLAGVTFYTVGQVVTTPSGAVTMTLLGNFDEFFAPYNPNEPTVEPGECYEIVYSNASIARSSHTATTQVSGQYLSYEVCNVGMSIGTITLGASTTELKVGECWECSAILDLTDNTFVMCGPFQFNPLGSEFILTTSTAP